MNAVGCNSGHAAVQWTSEQVLHSELEYADQDVRQRLMPMVDGEGVLQWQMRRN